MSDKQDLIKALQDAWGGGDKSLILAATQACVDAGQPVRLSGDFPDGKWFIQFGPEGLDVWREPEQEAGAVPPGIFVEMVAKTTGMTEDAVSAVFESAGAREGER